MELQSDHKSEFKRRLQAQIADAFESVDFNGHAIQPGLHLMQSSPVSASWSDRINTLRRLEIMRTMVQNEPQKANRPAA